MHLLTGATGYIGGRLLRRLQADGVAVRCLCRNPEALGWRLAPGTELVQGDLLDPASLDAAFAGVDTAFYLVHSMNGSLEFETEEHEAALNFALAARQAGVKKIVYLGGLAQGAALSAHMRSRADTGNTLRASGIPVIEFQASVVIGSGSASFEMIRALVERLPVMITPRWVNTAAQPIAIEDVIDYLAASVRLPAQGNLTFEIGGADTTSYVGIMREYARQRKLRRWIVRVPFLSLSLSSRWLTLITPVYAGIGRCLIESVRNPSVVHNPEALAAFDVRPMGIVRAIERALANEDRDLAETRWSDAGRQAARSIAIPLPSASLLVNEQIARVAVSPDLAFVAIRRIGGRTGWYYGNALWKIRGLFDLMLGGVGMRRGRPDPDTPFPGSTLDFWRVEAFEPARKLRLFAEMKVPGRAWLEFTVEPEGAFTVIRQIAQFEPKGLAGLLYWYLLHPIHAVMFRGMLRRIAAAATPGVCETEMPRAPARLP
ncbi:MAG: SDR family oxidoreductase [Acidobacteriota bacterium]|nr:SDR family oxidoreductase [Acidobacteriota bacterium]